MQPNAFTHLAQEAIQEAAQEVIQRGQQIIAPAHLLFGMLKADKEVIPYFFQKAGFHVSQAETWLEKQLQSYAKVSGGQPYPSQETNAIFQEAQKLMKTWQDDYVALEHLLAALAESPDPTGRWLKEKGLSAGKIKEWALALRGGRKVSDQGAEGTYNALAKYAGCCTSLVAEPKTTPCSLGNPALEKRPLPKDLPTASSKEIYRKIYARKPFFLWTWACLLPVPSTKVNLKKG
jgi:ATP-dependent Clp protease ATP-binding subunit ClpB